MGAAFGESALIERSVSGGWKGRAFARDEAFDDSAGVWCIGTQDLRFKEIH